MIGNFCFGVFGIPDAIAFKIKSNHQIGLLILKIAAGGCVHFEHILQKSAFGGNIENSLRGPVIPGYVKIIGKPVYRSLGIFNFHGNIDGTTGSIFVFGYFNSAETGIKNRVGLPIPADLQIGHRSFEVANGRSVKSKSGINGTYLGGDSKVGNRGRVGVLFTRVQKQGDKNGQGNQAEFEEPMVFHSFPDVKFINTKIEKVLSTLPQVTSPYLTDHG